MGWLDSIFNKIEESRQQRKLEEEQEKQRLRQVEAQKAQKQMDKMHQYAQWYMQGIRNFLNDLEREGFHPTGGFESYPYIDFNKPFTYFITKENDLAIFDFTQVRGIALDDHSKRMLFYEIRGNQRSAYLNGAAAPENLVAYKMFDYSSIVKATYTPVYNYETRYDDSEAMASAIAGGIIDGLTGGRAGAYMAFSSASAPVSVTTETLNGVRLEIETTEPGYEKILFRGTHFKDTYCALLEGNYNPVADTVFRSCFEGVFSKTPYYVEDCTVNRKNGTKKDFMFGLGPYVSQHRTNNNSDPFAPSAQIGVLSYYLEQFSKQINRSIGLYSHDFSRGYYPTWRDCCEDGFGYGIDPEDYETEDEYNEALNEAKYGWREYCEDGVEFGIDPEDYETEEEYNEALEEAKREML